MHPDEVVLSAAVMTHPARLGSAQQLCDTTPDLGLRMAVDPCPDGIPTAWRAARIAWSAVADQATHHLVVQDDVVLAPGITDWIRAAVAARPDVALCLFTEWGSRTSHAVRVAALCGDDWAPVVDDYIPCVGLVLPAAAARGFDSWADRHTTESDPDDVVLLDYLAALEMPAVVPVRGPVEHDAGPSLVGNSTMGLRRSVCFGGAASSAATGALLPSLGAVPYYDWWEQQAWLFVRDDTLPDGWRQVAARQALAEHGLDPTAVLALLGPALDGAPGRDVLLDVVSRIVLDEVFLTAYLIGLVSRTQVAVPQLTRGPVVERALGTLPEGALRRIIPTGRLAEVSALLAPVVRAGVELGFQGAPVHGAARRASALVGAR